MATQTLETAVLAKVNEWLNGNYDADTKQEIQSMLDNGEHETLTDSFYKDLEFGTGGLRGKMGVGSNRVNKYTIGMATQGFANYLNKKYPNEKIKVAIAHDSRNNSEVFTKITSEVFSANGIYVYVFEALRATPELSFAVRELGCKGGVILTASHNPKEYNGYKAYGENGGQLVSPFDTMVLDEVRKVDMGNIKFDRNDANIEMIGEEMDNKYYDALAALSVSKDAIKRQKDLKIVFSPIHGTGAVSVPPILKRFGFENVMTVKEQMVADGNFPTVVYPNPEEKEAMSMALAMAKEVDADIIMATDPDADRVGVGVKNMDGEFVLLNGNQAACLLIKYMLEAWKKADKLDGNQYTVKTIVTSYMIDKISASYEVECYNTLTGFKYIGEIMTQLEGQKTFIAGGEESYGYLIGEHARDKDAVISCAMMAEMVAFYKDQGTSIFDALIELYLEYGFYKEKLIAIKKEGRSGAAEIQAMLKKLREEPPATLAGSKVTKVIDYKSSVAKDMTTGETSKVDLPSSNVLQFYTADGSIVSARPSGTEPKVKFYCSVNEPLASKAEFKAIDAKLDAKLDAILTDLGAK